ncbi:two-component system regulatory protein YycI [Paenibacillus silvisoli]|uniref:two-component system regulatory protein YycI n=1 Tax=Paenibacillus silvisoli TaxID=3110539 RepID=UPI002805F25B|nr:two-component system regulatory protein YycI [Paenibacillus silvisoli]
MDWGRAKSVLIFAFLLLNLVLGYQLWSNIREGLRTSANVSDLSPEAQALMEEKKIKLGSAGIPSETPELRDLTYRIKTKLGQGERHELKKPVDSKVVFDSKELKESLGGIIPELGNYALGAVYENEFILYRMAEGRPMFDVKLELFYNNSNQKIIAYKQDLIELLPSQDAASQSVLSATKVVTSLIENQLRNGAVIEEIKLGYHGQIFDSDIQVSAPTWRVLLEDGGQYYMNAISGEFVTE